MRILILSDAHGANFNLIEALEKEREAELVYYLGDGANAADDIFYPYRNKKCFITLKGNCDLGASFPERDIRNVNGAKIYACHGHNENVKYTYSRLKELARENGCKVALFGHTHTQYYDYDDGLYLFNPGSIRNGEYGVADIEESGILFTEKKLF